ncbi:nitrile hydratase subunit alpha [Bradyrhizobium sp. CNPSo 4010]|uniref:nitrile hydratase n=1 Tax=Bradyrhizobium agreste TaxID=2751811 RepID=A0ABS0PJ67_9BRAD|nr:nitrile hydratase subunit alpha [Bradyrhizobium agreste]MBH5397246.1 nitrile hydratase subunit alpha [Bradyrhizobium agreste]
MSDEEFTDPPAEFALRVRALETLLSERGIIDPKAVDELVDIAENRIGPKIGARIVARAWVDPDYRRRLLERAEDVTAELVDITGANIVVLENTDLVHNVIVCTLCSCYPFRLLGSSPGWYKSPAYRSRIVREPRQVLREFGLEVPTEREIRVWDSNAELRYLVLPQRPVGTEGWTEDALAQLVTRNSMIGTGVALTPDAAGSR